jgi:CBS domain-containing protein
MHDIAEFLRRFDPFNGLDEQALERLAERAEVEFFPAGETIFPQGERHQRRIRVVRRGAIELVDRGRVIDVVGEGELFGHPSALSGLPTGFAARAREDSLCYSLAAADVIPLLSRPESLGFLARSLLRRRRPGSVDEADVASAEVAQQSARDLIRRRPVICPPEVSIREAARRMVDEGVSSVLVSGRDGDLGIVTDGDLRSRVVADGLAADAPVCEAMTTPVITVRAEQTGADVMLAMLDNDIRHVPVLSPRSEVLGVIVGIDLVAAEARTPFVLRREIAEARNKGELREAAAHLGSSVVALHRARLSPPQISILISVVADALIRRMIELAIESEGPPPVEFAWHALGSHGRREPVPSSDVDSGMAWRDVREEAPDIAGPRRVLESERTTRYMHGIAEDVTDCIRVVGWRLDPHGVNARDEFSASSIGDWRRAIRSWLSHPDDERVLIATSILLDGRTIYGPERDLDVRELLYETGGRRALLHWMLRLALSSRPPTGFIRNFVVEHSGARREGLDIKHLGMLPIVDLARYAALKAEVRVTPTVERLRAAADEGVLEATQARVLEEAFHLFAGLRLEHQVSQIEAGLEPDDRLEPRELNRLTRRYLRDAFREVAAVQRWLGGMADRGSR